MKQNKCKEILKVAGASVLSIALLCAVFIAGNQLVFAYAANQTRVLPNVTATAAATRRDVRQNAHSGEIVKAANALSQEAAAEFGAEYIYEVFGVVIDISAVQMSYTTNPFGARDYWVGWVAGSYEQIHSRGFDFSFHVDAVSGQRISIRDLRRHESDLPEVTVSLDEVNALFAAIPENIEYLEAIAKELAKKHFNLTEVVGIEFSGQFPMSSNRSPDGVTFRETTLMFTAYDDTGREAVVSFIMEAGRLVSICTMHSDVIPGVTPPIGTAPAWVLPYDQEAIDRALQMRERGTSDGIIDLGRITMEELEEIRNNPNHPRYDEIFNRTR